MTSPFPQIASPPQASAEVIVNEALETLQHQAVYGKDHGHTSGLVWGYYGGMWGGFLIVADTVTLTDASANYFVVEIATGDPSVSTANTDWLDTANFVRVYKITTAGGVVTAVEDHRAGPSGVSFGGGGGVGGGAGVSGLEFTASSTTTDSDPGTGTLRWNNATQASATILYIDNADGDSTSLATLWASLSAGTLLTITDASDADVWQLWKVTATPTNGTGYYKFTVSLQAQEGGNIANASSILLDVDASGGGGDASTNTSSSVDSEAVLFSGTGGKTLKRATGTGLVKRTSGVDSTVPQLQVIPIACGDETTAITTGTAKVTFRMPFAFTLATNGVRASVTTAPTGTGNLTVDVNESGSTILSTKLTFDASEKTTTTAATPPVISDSSLADDAEITIDVDAVSGTITGTGLKVYLIGWPA